MRDYKIIEGNLLDADAEFICHQVNCQGKMASGVARAIRNKYPEVYKYYKFMYDEYTSKGLSLLGQAQYVPIYDKDKVEKPFYCINMFAQDKYGYDGRQYTSLDAFKNCLRYINMWAKDKTVAFPWKIACVRGGANWDEVLPMILEELTDVKEIYFYKLDNG